jgi:hypothetical protein
MVTTQPAVRLFRNRGIKIPLPGSFTEELRICSWVTMILTKLILLAVLALEVKDIDCQSHILKERVIFDSLSNGAVVIKKYVIRLGAWDTICPLDHLLFIHAC